MSEHNAFVGYDAWLERPYQDDCDRAAREEWLDENTTFTTDCCGEEVDADIAWFVKGNKGEIVVCLKCQNTTTFTAHVPVINERESYPTPDDYDDYDRWGWN